MWLACHPQVIDITWPVSEGARGLPDALDRICENTAQAIDDGYDFVVLSDRAGLGCGGALLALGAAGAGHC